MNFTVLERCKEAAKMIEEIEANKARLPFTLKPSAKLVPTMKSDPKMGARSPLTMNDNNMNFLSQAKIVGCRDAMQANPLRNISGKLFQLCRNVGLDLVDVSQKVQRKIEVEREKEMRLEHTIAISTNIVDPSKKKVQRSCQTDKTTCAKCEERDRWDENPENFTARLDAQQIENMSRAQYQVMAAFCQAFSVVDDRFKLSPVAEHSQWDSDNEIENHRPPPNQRENDDYKMFANPENPTLDKDDGFLRFSPLRKSPSRSPICISRSRSPMHRSRSRSPKRRRVIDRLGAKISSPRNARFREDEDRMLNPAPPYHIPSPPMQRSYGRLSPPPNGYRERSPSPPPRFREKRSRTPERGQRRGRY
jgi:hypothetical protein